MMNNSRSMIYRMNHSMNMIPAPARRLLLGLLAALPLLAVAGCNDLVLTVGTGNEPAPSVDSGLPEIVSSERVTCTDPSFIGKAIAEGTFDAVPGRYIVMLREGASATKINGFAKGVSSQVYRNAVNGFSARLTEDEVARLESDPDVEAVEPDYRVRLDPSERAIDPTREQVMTWGVDKVGGARDGSGKTAWILDTGIDLGNLDLNVDRARSRNFVGDGQGDAQDRHGHGTHVAGIIGARDNSIGVVGLAANARLVGVRVLDDTGSGSYSAIIAGIDYVVANARSGDVMNLSLGGPASRMLDEAVRRAAQKGIKVVVAAGNEGQSVLTTSPARLNYPGVYTVSAFDRNGRIAPFSNYGSSVDVAAPGVMILSTRIGGGALYMSGTSMAAPHVAGLLLFGSLHGNGYVANDPDGCADPIAHI